MSQPVDTLECQSCEQLRRELDECRDEEYQEGVNAEYWYREFEKLKSEVLRSKDLELLKRSLRTDRLSKRVRSET